ncbi:MAG: hypothetical protein HQ477_11065 [Chloroflexi bacterium]|nr:hypothetical protein [Chloroflexota bacterium]
MYTSSEKLIAQIVRPSVVFVFALFALLITLGSDVANAEVRSADIEAVSGTAVEVRPPSAIVVASNSGLVTLNFDSESELRIGSNKARVDEVSEGDRVVSTATRNADNELVALRTLVRIANSQPDTKHVVGVVRSASPEQLSIQTRNGDVVDVLIPAGIDAPSIGDGITMVARLDKSSGILTAVGFELTSKTVERIQNAQDSAADKAESTRLAAIAVEARSKHLSALDDAARAIKRVIDSGRTDPMVLDQAKTEFDEIQRRFKELQGIYESAARARSEPLPLLRISGGLANEIGFRTFTVVPQGEQDDDPFSVDFTYDPVTTTVDLPEDLLRQISNSAKNPQLLSDVRLLIDLGSEFDVKYSIVGTLRAATSLRVRSPRLVEELEAVLAHELRRAFNGAITFVEINATLADAQGIIIASNEKQDIKVAAKVTDETEITVNGQSSGILALRPGQSVDIQFESSEVGAISDITGSDVTLRAVAIRARTSAPVEEDHISGIVESIDLNEPSITIRPSNGSLISLSVSDDVPIVRNGTGAFLDHVRVGDLVIDATRTDVSSDELTRLVVVARSNVKFSGTVTGIGLEPARLQITGDNGQLLNILIAEETWVILDGRRVSIDAIATGMNVLNGVYSVTGLGGAFYNVATIVSIESPKVVRSSGIITEVNVVEGNLTILSGRSDETRFIKLHMPDEPLGENLLKDGLPIRSLLDIERGDRADIVFYVLESGVIEKLSVVSDNFIQSRGTLIDVSDNNRYVQVELINGKEFNLWIGPSATIHLNGRRISTIRSVTELLSANRIQDDEINAQVSEVLFIRDSLDSDQGVIISIKFQIKSVETDGEAGENQQNAIVELTVSGVIEAINEDRWAIEGQVFSVNGLTKFIGGQPEIGENVVAVLVSRRGGLYVAQTITLSSH